MWIEVAVGTTAAGELYIKSYKTEDEQQVELQESATSPSLLQFVARKANVTEEDLIGRGTWKFNIKMCDYEKYFRQITTEKPFSSGANQHIAVLMEQMLQVPDVNEMPEGAHVLAEFNEALPEDAAGAEDTSTISSLQDEDGTPAAGSSDTSIPKDRGTSRKRKRPSTALQEILELQKKAEERCASLAQQRVATQQEMLQLQRESNDTQKDILGVLKSYFEGRNKSSVN
ncbi:hypothetical protein HPB50_021827 [Hyalomma asiaticum]|uniref:Uncharacterized protein n=1 Tax=Hyalomma asiaticum TaxID=266040 RepID=A0ACB7RSB8_HYAAI|nr:hypothetical protein HPB50_021827 [Hyalomma asiaticum]